MSNNLSKKSLLHFASIAFCASFFWIVLGPLSIFINNVDGFTIDVIILIKHLSLIASSMFLVLLVMIVFLPEKLSNVFVRGVILVTLSSWVLSSFFYGDYGQLDGKELNFILWSWLGFSQLLVLAVLFVFIVKAKINTVYQAVYFVFFVGVISAAIGILNLDKAPNKYSNSGFHSGMSEMSPQSNILHVVLDALQSDLFWAAINSDKSLKDKFDGFTFFKNTSSVYPTTEMSIPMLLTGEVYRNKQPKKEFLSALQKQNLGINKLKGIGYRLDAHTICNGIVTPCTRIAPRVIDKADTVSEVIQILDLYIFKSVPDLIKPLIYNQGDWLLLNNSDINAYLKIKPVGLGHLIFSRFVEELEVNNDDPTLRYKFFHSLVTHSPVRLDAQCNIVPQEKLHTLSRVAFVSCGIKHFVQLLDKLKALGVYDQTMIILSSDHGASYKDGNFNEAFINRGISARVLSLASATLLIKPYESRGEVGISEAQVSLRDIPQTIIAASGINAESEQNDTFAARDILNMKPDAERTREYLHYTWEHKYWNEPKLPPMTVYPINGDIKDPLSWPFSLNVTGELTCNLQVLFNKPLSDVTVIGGLAGIERWGRWSNSHQAKIIFNLNTTECSRNKLSLKLKGFVTSKNTTQHAAVLLNGTQIGNVTIKLGEQNPREFVFSFPPELIKQGQINILEFHIENPVAPISVGVNNDTRLLGLGFESMVFQ